MDAGDEGISGRRRRHNFNVRSRQSESTGEAQKAWNQPVVVFCQLSDSGDRFNAEVDVVYPQFREYVMNRLRKERADSLERDRKEARFGCTRKQLFEVPNVTLLGTSGPKELDVVENLSVLNKVVMPRDGAVRIVAEINNHSF